MVFEKLVYLFVKDNLNILIFLPPSSLKTSNLLIFNPNYDILFTLINLYYNYIKLFGG